MTPRWALSMLCCQVALSSRERAELERCMQDTGGISDVREALMGMDVMEAEAQDPADAEKIKARIAGIGPAAVNRLLRSSMAEAYVEQMPTDMTRFMQSPAVIGSYACYSCCAVTPISIASIVYAVSGPCAMVYRLCVALIAAQALGTLIPIVPLLSHMAKLIHGIASAGVGGWRAMTLARRKLGSAVGVVAKSLVFGMVTGLVGLIVTGAVAISQQGCRPMCYVMWVIVAAMAVPLPLALVKLQASVMNKVMDEEGADDDEEDSSAARRIATGVSVCCSFCLMWTFALIVGLVAGLHPDMQCANPEYVWEPDA